MKQTTVRLPPAIADAVETIARVRGTSVNRLIITALEAEIDRAGRDREFIHSLQLMVAKDHELLNQLASTPEREWTADEFFGTGAPPTPDDVPIAADGHPLDTERHRVDNDREPLCFGVGHSARLGVRPG